MKAIYRPSARRSIAIRVLICAMCRMQATYMEVRSKKSFPITRDDMEEFNVKFVKCVKRHPVLYDTNLTEYSRIDVTDKAWRQVAEQVGLSAHECRKRWKNLRTAFLRGVKTLPRRKAYYLHEALQFILPFTKAAIPTKSNSSENPQGPELTYSEDPSSPESAEWDPLSLSPPLPSADPTPPLTTPSVAQYSMPAYEEFDNDLPESKPVPNFEQPTEKRKISTSESDRPVAESHNERSSALHSKEERKEAILQFLNSLVPDLLTLTDPQLRSFKRRTLFLIDEVTGTTPL